MAGISGNNYRITGIGTTLGAATAPWMILLLLEAGITGNNSAGIIDYLLLWLPVSPATTPATPALTLRWGNTALIYLLVSNISSNNSGTDGLGTTAGLLQLDYFILLLAGSGNNNYSKGISTTQQPWT